MQDDKVIQNMDEQNEPQGDEVSWMDESGAEPQEVPATENEADAEDSDFEPDMEEPSQEEYTESSESAEFKYDPQELASILEALIFVSGDPVPIKRLKEVVETEPREIRNAIEVLSKRYEENDGGFQVMEVAEASSCERVPYSVPISTAFLSARGKFHSVDRLWNRWQLLPTSSPLPERKSKPSAESVWMA